MENIEGGINFRLKDKMAKNKYAEKEHTHIILRILIVFCLGLIIYLSITISQLNNRITDLEINKEIERTQNTRQTPITKNVTFVFDLDKKVWNNYMEIVEEQESMDIYSCYVTEFFIEKFEDKLLCVNWMGSQDIQDIEGENLWEQSPYLLEHEKCDYLFSYFDGAYYMENKSNIRIEFDCSLNSAGEIIKFSLVEEY